MKITNEIKVAVLGICTIFLLETIALLKGIDGTMFGASMAGIGGIIGWVFKDYYKFKNK